MVQKFGLLFKTYNFFYFKLGDIAQDQELKKYLQYSTFISNLGTITYIFTSILFVFKITYIFTTMLLNMLYFKKDLADKFTSKGFNAVLYFIGTHFL